MSYLKTVLIATLFALIAIGPALGAEYVGSDVCGNCHKEIYNSWKDSAHSKALIKAEDAIKAGFPMPAGVDPKNLQYTFMGKNLVIWIDKSGNIVRDQYKVGEKKWEPNVYGEDKFSCALCHTTGYDSKGTMFTGSNPYQSGTWKFESVGCERCHGAGSEHAAGASKVNIKVDNSTELCGQCHSQKAVTGLDPYRRYRNQYNDITQSKHYQAMTCIKCHSAHNTTDKQYSNILAKYDADLFASVKSPLLLYYKGSDGRSFTVDYEPSAMSSEALCRKCHPEVVINHYVATCTDCHMPKSRKLASQWDERSHTFRSDDGFTYSVAPAKNYPELTCNPCHKNEVILHPTSQVHDLLKIVPTPTPTKPPKPLSGFEAAIAFGSMIVLYALRRRVS